MFWIEVNWKLRKQHSTANSDWNSEIWKHSYHYWFYLSARRVTVATMSQFHYLNIKRNKVVFARRAEGPEIKSKHLTVGGENYFPAIFHYYKHQAIKKSNQIQKTPTQESCHYTTHRVFKTKYHCQLIAPKKSNSHNRRMLKLLYTISSQVKVTTFSIWYKKPTWIHIHRLRKTAHVDQFSVSIMFDFEQVPSRMTSF